MTPLKLAQTVGGGGGGIVKNKKNERERENFIFLNKGNKREYSVVVFC